MTACQGPVRNCPDCGDRMIHQSNRGPHESSSAFGQYMHDRGEAEKSWREMFWMDVDGVIFKSATSILRVVEHKPHVGTLSAGQKVVLPLIAKALQTLAATGLIHHQSGVFVLYSDHPHDRMLIHQVKGWPLVTVWKPVQLDGTNLERFLRGEPIDPFSDVQPIELSTDKAA